MGAPVSATETRILGLSFYVVYVPKCWGLPNVESLQILQKFVPDLFLVTCIKMKKAPPKLEEPFSFSPFERANRYKLFKR